MVVHQMERRGGYKGSRRLGTVREGPWQRVGRIWRDASRGRASPNACTVAMPPRRAVMAALLTRPGSPFVKSHLPINHVCHVVALAEELHHLFARYSVHPRPIRRDVYSQQKKIPEFFSSSVRCFVKSSMAACTRATPFTTATTSIVLGTPKESRTDFRTSQGDVSGFRRGTGTKGTLARGKREKTESEKGSMPLLNTLIRNIRPGHGYEARLRQVAKCGWWGYI
jgi:hypothetical protein